MKTITLILLLFIVNFLSFAKDSIESQADRLHQYAGHWVTSDSVNTENVGAFPAIKMNNISTMNNQSMQVEVLQYQNGKYIPLLTELLGYDTKSDKIIALGQNQNGVVFKGEGRFSSDTTWKMQDVDMTGEFYLRVDFNFQTPTNVLLEGFNEQSESLWKTRYIKANPKDKNIGIQLVSVHQNMLKDPEGTLKELGRMGYSYVETFVYDKGAFYGMSPTAFSDLVNANGMEFLGSMTFHDLPAAGDWEKALTWWATTIDDHVEAGVEYLTTSNNQLKSVKTKDQLKRYSDYYNAIGKLCREKGITFAFHNHADEFALVEGVKIYDYFLQNTDPDYVAFQADIYWMDVAGVKPVDYFKKYPNRFLSWHIKDYKELGASGKIDWMALFHNKDFDVPKYMLVEVEDYSYPPMYSVQLAWEYLYDALDY